MADDKSIIELVEKGEKECLLELSRIVDRLNTIVANADTRRGILAAQGKHELGHAALADQRAAGTALNLVRGMQVLGLQLSHISLLLREMLGHQVEIHRHLHELVEEEETKH